MKRIWIGIVLLVTLLGLGIWSTYVMDDIHSGISEDLEKAARILADPGWEDATDLARQAQEDWQAHRKFSAALSDHGAIDEIDGLFAELEVYEDQQDVTHYAATCAELSECISALEESHRLSWWNLL